MSERALLTGVFVWGIAWCVVCVVALVNGQGWGGVLLIAGACWVLSPVLAYVTRDDR